MPDDHIPMSADTNLLPMEALAISSLPISLQIFFNDRLFLRCKEVAKHMAQSQGAVPNHLVGKPESCFAVLSNALSWRLDPYAVARTTYQTPGGSIGYMGALCQAILEGSNRLEGGIRFEHFGPWERVQRKFKIETSQKGGKYAVPTYTEADEEGCGVTVVAQVKREAEPRRYEFYLSQAWPRNSTLWATDPKTQICYTAVRRFASVVAPSLFMGVPFDREEMNEWVDTLKDVTPVSRPSLAEYGENGFAPAPKDEPKQTRRTRQKQPEPQPEPETEPQRYAFFDSVGVEQAFDTLDAAVAALTDEINATKTERDLTTLRDNCADFLSYLDGTPEAEDLNHLFNEQMTEVAAPPLDAEPAGKDAAATSTTSAPAAGPSGTGEAAPPSEFGLAVPLPPQGIDGWYQPARLRVKAMMEAGCGPDDFRKFREVNSAHLAALSAHGAGWFRMLDELIVKGEGG